jgi:hypothetical protein
MRRRSPLLAAFLLALTAGIAASGLVVPLASVRAATVTVNDGPSCTAASGSYNSSLQRCTFSSITVAAGDTLALAFNATLTNVFFSNLTVNGTLTNDAFTIVAGSFANTGTVDIGRRLRILTSGSNTGTITVHSSALLELFPNPAFTNGGTINVLSGGNLSNDGSLTNNGVISLACGVAITGNGTYSGTPPVTPDCTPPTVTIDQAAGQADPTGTSPILFDVVFSEPVTGFTAADVVLSGTAGSTTSVVSGSGPTYQVEASGMTASGTVIATIPAGAAVDAGSNASTASTSTDDTVTYAAPAPPSASASAAPPSVTPSNPTAPPSDSAVPAATTDQGAAMPLVLFALAGIGVTLLLVPRRRPR